MTGNKRFTDIEHDYENARIRCKDNGMFMLYAIYENDDGLPTLGDLLNEQEKTIEQIKKESKEFKRHIMSNIELAEKQLKTGEGNQEHIIIYKNVCEEILEAMPALLLWDGDVE